MDVLPTTPRSGNYYQYSPTTSLQSLQVGQMLLPRKLRKTTRWKTTFFTARKIVPHCLSELSTSCREELPNYLAVNLLQDQSNTRHGTTCKVLVILNPNSGFPNSRDVSHKKVQSTLKLSGFVMEVIKTAYAGHAKDIASAVDLSKCPDDKIIHVTVWKLQYFSVYLTVQFIIIFHVVKVLYVLGAMES